MKTSSQILLTLLLNACWQIALVAALASVSSWLFRNSAARYRHWIWVAALLLSVGIPLTTSTRVLRQGLSSNSPQAQITERVATDPMVQTFARNSQPAQRTGSTLDSEPFLLSSPLALSLIGVYFAFLFYSGLRLGAAWYATRRMKLNAVHLEDQRLSQIVERCATAIKMNAVNVRLCSTESVSVPITIGMFNPVIILPRQLLNEGNDEVLTSAIGHELIHVQRRDYAFNLAYELLFLPLSFHPAAALMRRRIRQTRELSCDELVAERILNAEVYARSLVQLASSAPTLRRLSITTTVGIADADILEARIMSLLNKTKVDTPRKRMLLIAVSLLLLVPCLAAGSFAMKFDLKTSEAVNQEPSQQEKQRREEETVKLKRAMAIDEGEMKERMEKDPRVLEELIAKQNFEMKMRAVRQSALVKMARITMDQAIQIATSQKPGNVLQCSLDAEHWEEPGKLAKDGFVFYRVVLVSNEDIESGAATHVWVNAVDGTIIRTEKELPRKPRQE
jgi:beta-lactamase regulating signal transducer with metallopeptidase domain